MNRTGLPVEPFLCCDASAGCGKTEALAMRLLALLLAGVPQNQVCAMTFTRAAAAEIYERLLMLLVRALRSPEGMRQFLAQLGPQSGSVDRAALSTLLRELLDHMGKLHISTIDSFMHLLIGAYSLELGLGGDAAICDPAECESIKEELLPALFADCPAADMEELLGICRDAAFGQEKKEFFQGFRDLIGEAMKYAEVRHEPEIWGGRAYAFNQPEYDRREALTEWRRHYPEKMPKIMADARKANRARQLDSLLEKIAGGSGETRFTAEELTVLRNFFDAYQTHPNEPVKPSSFAWVGDLPEMVDAAVKLLMLYAARLLVMQSCQRTGGIRRLLETYLDCYDRRITGNGKLQFADLPRLLIDGLNSGSLCDLAYRMNGRIRHWLFDEFQDTSREQYRIFQGILGDMDRESESLYIVGDVKQAIYNWRNGDSHLMGQAAAEYALTPTYLRHSYRYGEGICEGLNRLFGPGVLDDSPLPEKTKARWRELFHEHHSAAAARRSEFCVQSSPRENLLELDARRIAEKLREIDFARRHLECAVLVQSRKDAIALKAYWASGYPDIADAVVFEGEECIFQDRIVRALAELTLFLQHPDNTVSREVLHTQRFYDILGMDNTAQRSEYRMLLCRKGFYGLLTELLGRLRRRSCAVQEERAAREAALRTSAVAALLCTARDCDRNGIRDAGTFYDAVRNCSLGSTALAGKVRMMTMHHSKGLGFDVVFCVLNEQKYSLQSPDTGGFAVRMDAARRIQLIVHSPKKEGMFFTDIREGVNQNWEDSAFEALARLYVAATRAKYSLNILLPEMPENGTAFYLSTLVYQTFGQGDRTTSFHCGDPLWYESFKPGDAPFTDLPVLVRKCAPLPPRRVNPSRGETPLYFRLPSPAAGTELGNAVHAFFAGTGFWEELPAVPAAIRGHIQPCLTSPEVKMLLSRHAPDSELWAEKRFEVILGDRWVSGCFDRVEIIPAPDGSAERCILVDYKSNAVCDERAAERYKPQLRLYREVLQKMLFLPPAQIETYLLFTASGTVIPV